MTGSGPDDEAGQLVSSDVDAGDGKSQLVRPDVDTGGGKGQLVRLDIDSGGVALIFLDDPARRNCVSPRLSADLALACDQVNRERSVKAVVLTGNGPVFSAGGEIDSLNDPGRDLDAAYRGLVALGTLAVPAIAAVNGPAVGAGINFALACDVILASRSARFDARFLDIGIHPGGGHLWRLNRLTGPQVTAALVLCGEVLTAEEAERRGLIWRAVDDDGLIAEAMRLARRAAARSAELVKRTKATLRASVPITDERMAMDLERVAQDWSMGRPAFTEGARKLREQVSRGSTGRPRPAG